MNWEIEIEPLSTLRSLIRVLRVVGKLELAKLAGDMTKRHGLPGGLLNL